MLIFFDLLLALVLGLVIYSISGPRPAEAAPGFFDFAQLALVVPRPC